MEDHVGGSKRDNPKETEADKHHKCDVCDAAFEFEESLAFHIDNMHSSLARKNVSKGEKFNDEAKNSNFELPQSFEEIEDIPEMELTSDDDTPLPSPLPRCQC